MDKFKSSFTGLFKIGRIESYPSNVTYHSFIVPVYVLTFECKLMVTSVKRRANICSSGYFGGRSNWKKKVNCKGMAKKTVTLVNEIGHGQYSGYHDITTLWSMRFIYYILCNNISTVLGSFINNMSQQILICLFVIQTVLRIPTVFVW